MGKNKIISGPELIQILGCSEATLAEWRKKGAPYHSGRPCRYNVDAFCDWLKSTSRIEYAAKLEPHCVRYGSGEAGAVVGSKPGLCAGSESTVTSDNDLSIEDFSLFDARNMLAGLLARSSEQFRRLRPVDQAALATTIKTLTENFRKIEGDCLDLEERLKRTVRVDLLVGYIGAAFSLTKNQLRNIPYAASQEIAELTGGDPGLIADILKRNIDAALAATAHQLTKEAVSDEIDRKASTRSID